MLAALAHQTGDFSKIHELSLQCIFMQSKWRGEKVSSFSEMNDQNLNVKLEMGRDVSDLISEMISTWTLYLGILGLPNIAGGRSSKKRQVRPPA